MKKKLSLSQYVKKRNGVPLGHKDSLVNMLTRAFTAGSFDIFWQYWNPIWGYYLSVKVMRPLNKTIPLSFAIILTFLVSGLVHDIAISIVKWTPFLFFTQWFGLMGVLVVLLKHYNISYKNLPRLARIIVNLLLLSGAYYFTTIITNLITRAVNF